MTSSYSDSDPSCVVSGETKQEEAGILPAWGLPDIGIPAEILFHPKLNLTEKVLFGFIRNLSYSENGCWASNRYLGGLIGVGPQTISNAVAKLKKWRAINVKYMRKPDGTEKRMIYVNSRYPAVYAKMITTEKGYKEITRGVVESEYPSIKTRIPPYKEMLRIIREKNKREEKEEKNHCPTEEPEDQSGFWQDQDQEDGNQEGNHSTAKQAMVAEENKTVYLPLASKLAGIVQSKKNIRFTPSKIQSWANEIRRLVKTDGITAERIHQALDWYETNIGGAYVPVVESGASLRQKFLRLEAAIERDASYHRATAPPPAADSSRNGNSVTPATTPGPRRLIQEYIGDKTLTKAFIQDCLKPAESLLSNGNGGLNRDEQSKLAHKLISLHRQIIQAQDQHFTNSLREVLPYYGPMELVGTYVTWIRDSDWIDHPSSNMLDISHSLFSRFKREYSRQIDHLARDPLTGQPDVRE